MPVRCGPCWSRWRWSIRSSRRCCSIPRAILAALHAGEQEEIRQRARMMASVDEGIGAILCQDQGQGFQPISCASKKLSKAERNYSTIEKECLALVWGVQKFAQYLYGRTFVVQTDHRPLLYG